MAIPEIFHYSAKASENASNNVIVAVAQSDESDPNSLKFGCFASFVPLIINKTPTKACCNRQVQENIALHDEYSLFVRKATLSISEA